MRGREVFVVESLHDDELFSVNDKLTRVLFLLATLRDAGATRLTCIAPYLCYARMDRRSKPRDPVTNRYVATLFEAMGIDAFVTIDVHDQAAYENAFRVPTEHLTAGPAFVEALAPRIGSLPVAVVSPDTGGLKRAEQFRKLLEVRLGRPVGSAFVEKARSDQGVRTGAVAGDLADRVAIIVDDLVSTGTTLARAASACRARGARAVYAAATHGVFSGDAVRTLRESPIERIVVVDTIPLRRASAEAWAGRVEVLDAAPLLAAAIHRLYVSGSASEPTRP